MSFLQGLGRIGFHLIGTAELKSKEAGGSAPERDGDEKIDESLPGDTPSKLEKLHK